ncbi:hypothetical protein BDQ12DRAFT_691592 [Crucibulum laeve]|uniref:Uncharacterized protein n=1 Tax=Crucibulum laeve TaxID=68775 RepID=A0A5C3LJV5_9AGAR|nr:hypothetical protein BDQ12DRAFT_691592 [Crucibulum laeve]
MLKLGQNLSKAARIPSTTRAVHRVVKLASTERIVCAANRQTLLLSKSLQKPLVCRKYSTQPPPQDPSSSASNASEKPSDSTSEIPPVAWLQVLETTASAPWLAHVPTDPADRLRRSYTLILQIVLYLSRPQQDDGAEQFLSAFSSFPSPPYSEIARARRSVATLVDAVVRDISSIPPSPLSPLRTQYPELFAIAGALEPLRDEYLGDLAALTGVSDAQTAKRAAEIAKEMGGEKKAEQTKTEEAEDNANIKQTEPAQEDAATGSEDGDAAVKSIEQWREFWMRAQPALLSLGMKLDEDGFGMGEEGPGGAGA